MWFNRSSAGKTQTYPLAGMNHYLDGYTAATVASMVSGTLLVRGTAEFDRAWNAGEQRPVAIGGLPFPEYLRRAESPATLLNRGAGLTATGTRCTLLTDSLAGLRDTLPAVAGRHLPLVVHLGCLAANRQASARQGGHDEYHAAAASGWFQFFAASPQEVVDLGLIAQRLAETALIPGMVAQDCFITSHGIRLLQLPGQECIEAYLGRPDDLISAPTPAQAMLFTDQRRRIPVLVNQDAPAGLGLAQGPESFFIATAAQRPFFSDHLESLAAKALQAYGDLTGRFHSPLSEYQAADAEYLVLAQGAITLELRHLVDRLREQGDIKAGALGLTMLRPFPGARLTHILKGKKGLTVLERIDQPLAEDLPMIAEVRAALDKAHENAKVQGGDLPYPGYASYSRPFDRPSLYSGIHGIGTELPSSALLHAVYTNMAKPGAANKRFYLGGFFNTPDRRFPQLQATGQQILRAYPKISRNALGAVAAPVLPAAGVRTIRLVIGAGQHGLVAVNTLARGLAYTHNWKVNTVPDHGYSQDLSEGAVVWQYSEGESLPGSIPNHCDILLVSAPDQFNNSSTYESLVEKGIIILQTDCAHQDLWNRFTPELKEWIRKRQPRIATIGPATRHNSAVTDDLTPWVLLGAGLAGIRELVPEGPGTLGEFISNQLQSTYGLSTETASGYLAALRNAGTRLVPMNWQHCEDNREPVAEADSPWNLPTGAAPAGVFDARRFWHSVAYLYRTGQTGHLPADPAFATGIVPAGSGAGRDLSAQHFRMPDWQPEKCTGCGECWSLCPESALPSALYTVQSLVGFAVKSVEGEGKALIQIKRLQDALARQAYQIAQRDGLHQFTHFDQLLAEAFRQLLEKVSVDSKQQAALQEEFILLNGCFKGFRAVRTEAFFDRLHNKTKGNGALLAISLNPAACTACGLCVAVCPERAFEWAKTSPKSLTSLHHNWKLQMQLPETAEDLLEAVGDNGAEAAAINRLLRKSAYLAMSGGDGSVPGNIAKAVIHNIIAAVESVMQPRFTRHARELEKLSQALQEAIQGKLTEAVKINDFEDFAHKLNRLGTGGVSTDRLVSLVSGERTTTPEHQARLQRLASLLEKIHAIGERYTSDTHRQRARMILALDPEAARLWNGVYPYNPHTNPWISLQPEETAGLAEGLYEGTCNTLLRELELCRSAAAELQDTHFSTVSEPILAPLTVAELSPEERQLLPPVLVLCRSGSLSQTGLHRLLSGAAPIRVAMIESNPLPLVPGSETFHGGAQPGLHALLHADTFVVQSTAAHTGHLIRGVIDALEHPGPALLHVHAPEHPVNPTNAAHTLESLKLAGASRLFPAFTARRERGTASLRLNLHGGDTPDEDWIEDTLSIQTPAGTDGTLARRITPADWALQTQGHPQHFRVLGMGHLNPQMLPLTDYLELTPDQREGKEPYIRFADHNRQQKLAVVSPALVQAVSFTRDLWRQLQGLAEQCPLQPQIASTKPDPRPAETAPSAPAPADGPSLLAMTERLLALCGYSGDPAYFKRSLREFLGRDSGRPGDAAR